MYGTTGSYFRIMDMELKTGRALKQTDVDNHSYVMVITEDTAIEFFGHTDVEGETISLNGNRFQVVGVFSDSSSLENSAAAVSSEDEDSAQTTVLEGYIPYSTLTRIADNILDITQFYVSSPDEDTMDRTERAVEQIMLSRLDNDEDAFSIQSQFEVMETMQEVDNTMSLMMGGITAISLLVGGIGIMNIMLVSVTERTREIGIRKAIGAGRSSIMLQFLMESVIVSMAGCFAGIGFSWILLKIIGKFMNGNMTFTMNVQVVWIAVAFSGFIGIVFGLYPANKAARKKPIEALRYSG